MALRFVDLWRWDGRASRKTCALVGVIAFAIKSVVDRVLALQMLGYPRGLFLSYWAPLGAAVRFRNVSEPESRYLLLMLLWAMPFIWIGVAISVKRLRDAGQPLWLVILFFVPFINLLFFLALCFLPSRQAATTEVAAPWPSVRPFDDIIPRSQLGSALLSIALTACIARAILRSGSSETTRSPLTRSPPDDRRADPGSGRGDRHGSRFAPSRTRPDP